MTLLQVQNVYFSWHNREVLRGACLQMQEGEKVFLHGASGSGKTTFLNLVSGILLPNRGTITLLGEELTQLSASKRDKLRGNCLGYVFQMFNLLSYLTALENVVLACKFSAVKQKKLQKRGEKPTDIARQLLSSLQLADFIDAQVSSLSVGQQQRVAVARALIGEPLLLIADEPTSALDADLRAEFLQLLFACCHQQNTALLYVSHDKDLGATFDRSIAISNLC